jgi:hypothetical protein
MTYHRDDPSTWPGIKPLIIAHDVGRSRDRSTAVVGGHNPLAPGLIGIAELQELPQGLFGSARASALAEVDRRYQGNAVIVTDFSNDATYAEIMYQTFDARVVGLHISRHGDGMKAELRPVKDSAIPVYTIGRTHLLELLHTEMQDHQIRFVNEPMARRAYEQLTTLETEIRDTDVIYKCPPGQHDDLGISCAMLAWAARHPHLQQWTWPIEDAHRPRRRPAPINSKGWT